MCWTLLIAPAGNDGFLTSDNPVGFFHPSEGGALLIASAMSRE
jgi:hypothetical protein